MNILAINKAEVKKIQKVLQAVGPFSYPLQSENNFGFLRKLAIHAHDLPARLVDFLTDFKYEVGNDGTCLIKGFPIDDQKIQATPGHWRSEEADARTQEESLFLLLCSALLGDVIGWSTQQDGKIVHNIVPIEGDEYKQIGSSTLTNLWWHTEEAFHPYRCDYLALFCLRNQEKAATTFASVNSLQLSAEDKELLFSPGYTIYPDDSHLSLENAAAKECEGVFRMNEAPAKTPVLFGNYQSPYLCIDPYYMGKEFDNPGAAGALDNIIREIDRNLQKLVLEPGDVLFLDNYRVVHGRDAFKAHYDGTGRWLKRVNIVRDLRKSRSLRKDFESRIIETA